MLLLVGSLDTGQPAKLTTPDVLAVAEQIERIQRAAETIRRNPHALRAKAEAIADGAFKWNTPGVDLFGAVQNAVRAWSPAAADAGY